ncbi:MAG: hypothetical protein CL666_11560 [Balneola sp.]|nr:hypothetical protein [Balneola sp.]|tara:strand:+ start:27591 stop:28955 length:1365 start_codon:yes stop_codon:yes gene_type:complete
MRKFISQESGNKYQAFLDVINNEPFSISDIDHQSLLEFLNFGSFYFENTLLKGIRKRFTHQIFSLDIVNGFVEESQESDNPMQWEDIDDPFSTFLDFFEQRVHHLRDKKISVDLTGGIDSRLLATVLKHFGVHFDTAFSLNSGDAQEAKIVKQVADCLGVDLYILESDDIQTEEELDDLFRLSDGLWDLLKLKSLKDNQSWRQENGYDLIITGVGGELYKDFWWQQDFPFYNRNNADLEKLISMRMYPAQIDENWFGANLQKQFKNYQAEFRKKLQPFVRKSNTRTYDQIYYHVRIKEQVSILSNITSQFVDTYSPLLEPELLKIGYNLPRKKRFFNQFHREVITRINPEVAKIKTTEGNISVSADLSDKLLDIKNYGLHKTKSLVRKLRSSQTREQVKNDLKSFDLQKRYQEALMVLREAGFISNQIPKNHQKIGKKIVGRLITLAEVVKKIG